MFPANWYYGFDVDGQAFPKFSKYQAYGISLQYIKKEVRY